MLKTINKFAYRLSFFSIFYNDYNKNYVKNQIKVLIQIDLHLLTIAKIYDIIKKRDIKEAKQWKKNI